MRRSIGFALTLCFAVFCMMPRAACETTILDFDTVMQNVMTSGIWPSVEAFGVLPAGFATNGLMPDVADINGGLQGLLGDPIETTGNGMLDSDEFALFAAILADDSFDATATGGTSHQQVYDAWIANYDACYSALGGGVGGPESLLPPGSMIPDIEFLFSAYVTLGDRDSLGFPFLILTFAVEEELVRAIIGDPNIYVPTLTDFTLIPQYLAFCGDADGDGCSNLEEYQAYYPGTGRAGFIAAALDPGVSPGGCVGGGPCRAPEPVGDRWLRNPNNNHFYKVTNDDQLLWDEARAMAASMGGYLTCIGDAVENDWIHMNLGFYAETGIPRDLIESHGFIGANDIDVEDQWVWDHTGEHFWTGRSGGAVEPGMYANWNGGEPNDAGGEDIAQFYWSEGTWNDHKRGECLCSGIVEADLFPGISPKNIKVEEGGAAVISVEEWIWMEEPVTYQWQKDGIDIPGATSDQLIITDATEADAGQYTCVITDASPAVVNTMPATLTLLPPMPAGDGAGWLALAALIVAAACTRVWRAHRASRVA